MYAEVDAIVAAGAGAVYTVQYAEGVGAVVLFAVAVSALAYYIIAGACRCCICL